MHTEQQKQVAILSQPWGGLGDNLQFSTLPEMFHGEGIEFYISCDNVVRNQGIHDLVWKDNPYVKGMVVSEHQPNAGACKIIGKTWSPAGGPPQTIIPDCHIGCIEELHGFDRQNKYPYIAYEPKVIEEIANSTIVDTSTYFKRPYYENKSDLLCDIITSHQDYKDSESILMLGHSGTSTLNGLGQYLNDEILKDPRLKMITVESIYHLCDIIYSCRSLFCTTSGQNTLASAIFRNGDGKKIRCIADKCDIVGKNWLWDNLEYINIDDGEIIQ